MTNCTVRIQLQKKQQFWFNFFFLSNGFHSNCIIECAHSLLDFFVDIYWSVFTFNIHYVSYPFKNFYSQTIFFVRKFSFNKIIDVHESFMLSSSIFLGQIQIFLPSSTYASFAITAVINAKMTIIYQRKIAISFDFIFCSYVIRLFGI